LSYNWRALRRRILTPNVSETKLETRGFPEKNPASRQLLETVGETFLLGYAYAVEAESLAAAEERLEEVPPEIRGFAYEGAGMGFAMLDALPLGGGGRVTAFLAGRGADHIYMAYVGIGWAMARLPRFRWSRLDVPDPLLRWLVLDGYGFHQAYFHTARYVHEQYQDERFPWPADRTQPYANRAIDQGLGRAMWFVGGTDPTRVADMIDKFPESRRPDLYGGAGLAATYAGGGDEDELRLFWDRAGAYRPQLAQGSAFAAKARVFAGLTTPHTVLATRVFCDTTPERAAQVTDDARPDQPDHGDLPAYETWRQDISAGLVALRGVGK
jgi:hypothetical protein